MVPKNFKEISTLTRFNVQNNPDLIGPLPEFYNEMVYTADLISIVDTSMQHDKFNTRKQALP